MIIYGWRASHLASFRANQEACPHCGTSQSLLYSVYGRYVHVFWIPLFSIGKKGVVECGHCKYAMRAKEMPEKVKMAYRQIKEKTRVPWWHFTGLGLILLFAAFIIYADFIGSK